MCAVRLTVRFDALNVEAPEMLASECVFFVLPSSKSIICGGQLEIRSELRPSNRTKCEMSISFEPEMLGTVATWLCWADGY